MLCELYRVVLRLSCHRTKHLTEQPKGGRRVLTLFQGFRGSVQGCLASCTQQRVMAEEARGYFASWEMGIEGGGLDEVGMWQVLDLPVIYLGLSLAPS